MLKRRRQVARKKKYYIKKNYSNPFFREKRRRKIKSLSILLSWKHKLFLLELIIIIGGLAWFCFFSSYFTIDAVEVYGTEKIPSQEIEDLVWQQTKKRRYLFGLQKNLFLFDAGKLTEMLNQQYGLDELVISKKSFDTISINFKEKIYSAIWLEQEKYYYIDNQGSVISETNPLDIEQKNYPLIDYQGENRIMDKKIQDQEESINFITRLFSEFKKGKYGFKVERFIITSELNTVRMVVSEGPEILFNIKEDLDKQVNKLFILVNEKLKDDFKNKTYIDLKFGDRVYYR